MRPPAGVNFSALSTRLATARSNSSMSTAATGTGAAGSCGHRSVHALLRGALGEAQRDVVEHLADVELRRAAAGTTVRRGTPGRPASAPAARRCGCCAAPPAAVRGRRRAPASPAQRASSVSRQAVVAVSGERRSCDRLLTPSRRKWSSRRSCVPLRAQPRQQARESPCAGGRTRRRRGSARRRPLRPAPAPSKPSRAARATSSLSTRSGRVTVAMIQAASSVVSSDHRHHRRPAPAPARLLRNSSSGPAAAAGFWHTR